MWGFLLRNGYAATSGRFCSIIDVIVKYQFRAEKATKLRYSGPSVT